MTQTIQYDKNPSAEGSAARVSRASATPSLGTETFASWPPSGTRSHKMVATAATVATVGLQNADRPAASAGQRWSASAVLRNSSASTREIALRIVFYNAAGSTLGSAVGTASDIRSLAASQVASFAVVNALAPSGTASVDIQVSRNAVGSPASGDVVHGDQFTLTRTTSSVPYRDPAGTVLATWSSTPHASTQIYWDPSITLTPLTDPSPCPRVQVLIDDLPPAVASLTLTRSAEGRSTRVRGAVQIPVVGAYQTLDPECGFQVPSDYRAEMFTTAGASVGYTATASTTLNVQESWVHNPLDPQGATAIDVADTSGRELSRPVNGDRFYPEQRVLAMFVTGRRLGLQDVPLYFSTDRDDVASKFEAMLGGYDDDDATVPVLCLRTPPFADFPRTFYAAVMGPVRKPITVHMGGSLREWDAKADEAAPPFPGIVIPLLTRNDIDAAFATRDALDAAYPTRIAIDRDFTKVGLA